MDRWEDSFGIMVLLHLGTTSRIEKGLWQGNHLEGMPEIMQAGRASYIIYGARCKMKIWTVFSESREKGSLKVLKGKTFPFLCGLS